MNDLPAWIDPDSWAGYVEMRKKIKHPLTERGMRIAIRKLDQMREEGYDPNASLDESTFRSWLGVFPQGERKYPERVQQPASQKALATVQRIDDYYRRKATKDYLRDEKGRAYLLSPTTGEKVYQ